MSDAIERVATKSAQLACVSVLAYANAFSLWHYRAPMGHTVEDVLDDGYFPEYDPLFQHGDHLHISASDGGAIALIQRLDPEGPMYLRKMAGADYL